MSDHLHPRLALAVDVGGTKVAAALVDESGRIVPGSLHRAPTGPRTTRSDLADTIERVARDALVHAHPSAVIGVGIGSAGPVDLERGTISPKNMPLLAGFDIRERMSALVPGLPAVLRLDGTCIALAEHWLGATRGARHSMSMVVSTGVGGGLIVEGTLVAGRTGNAGHIGQIQIATRTAGSSSESATLEALASGPQTVAWARAQGWGGSSGEDLAADGAAGHPLALAAIRRSATAVGEAIASVSTLLDLEVVAIGGGFANVSPDYVALVASAVLESSVFAYAREVRVVASSLSGEGPLLGAGALIHRADLLGGPAPHPEAR